MLLSAKAALACVVLATSGLLMDSVSSAYAQDLFVSNLGSNNTITRFAATGGGAFSTTPQTITDPSLAMLAGLAFDAGGDLFIVSGNKIIEFLAGTTPGTFGQVRTLTDASLIQPLGLAFDGHGDLFAVNSYGGGASGSVTEFLAGDVPGTFSGVVTLRDPSLLNPGSVAVDAGGDLFVSGAFGNSSGQGTITEFLAGGTPGTFSAATSFTDPSLYGPTSLAVDVYGDLFVANRFGNTISEFKPGASSGTWGPATTFAAGLSSPRALAFDGRGNLFAVSGGKVVAFDPSGASRIIETGVSGGYLAFGPSVLPVLSSLTFTTPVPGGTVLTATVTLSGPVSADTVVGLSSSASSVVRLSGTVVIPAGSQSATFPINTFRSHTTKTVTLQATLGQVVQTQDLTITGR